MVNFNESFPLARTLYRAITELRIVTGSVARPSGEVVPVVVWPTTSEPPAPPPEPETETGVELSSKKRLDEGRRSCVVDFDVSDCASNENRIRVVE